MQEVQATSPAAGLFQKAHGKIIMLQRLDTQLAALMGQRRKLHEEIGEVHGQISGEFHRLINESDELPGKILSDTHPSRGHIEEMHTVG